MCIYVSECRILYNTYEYMCVQMRVCVYRMLVRIHVHVHYSMLVCMRVGVCHGIA